MDVFRGGLKLIDITTPRECVYQEFEEQPGPCPRCGGPLQQSSQTYLVVTQREKETADSFMIGGDIGWFCTRCPTVVINPEEVTKFLMHPLPHWDVGTEFALAGIVDLDAIPKEKRDLPLGDDDNPISLVEFTNISRDEASRRAKRQPEATGRGRTAPARKGNFEERYEDVLQNIEFGIISVYHGHPEMTDWEALAAIEALLRKYRAEARGRQARLPSLDPLADEIYNSVQAMCEWRLGREMPFAAKEGEPVEFSVEPIALDELIACLKRVRKSIKFWSREGGRQGYLTFVSQFVR
jgi:hypothetical protein